MFRYLIPLILIMSLAAGGQTTAVVTDRALGVNPIAPQTNGTPSPVFLSYAWVRVCTMPATGSPCTPVASITDQFGNPLSIIGGNFGQLQTDVVGRFYFGCTPGNYQIQVAATGSNTPQLTYFLTCPSNSGLLTANSTWTGTNTFSGTVVISGTLTVNGAANFTAGLTTNSLTVSGGGSLSGSFSGNPQFIGNPIFADIFFLEGAAPTATVGYDVCYGDLSTHGVRCSFNGGAYNRVLVGGISASAGSAIQAIDTNGNITSLPVSATWCESSPACTTTATLPKTVTGGATLAGASITITNIPGFANIINCFVGDNSATPAAVGYQVVSATSITLYGTTGHSLSWWCLGN